MNSEPDLLQMALGDTLNNNDQVDVNNPNNPISVINQDNQNQFNQVDVVHQNGQIVPCMVDVQGQLIYLPQPQKAPSECYAGHNESSVPSMHQSDLFSRYATTTSLPIETNMPIKGNWTQASSKLHGLEKSNQYAAVVSTPQVMYCITDNSAKVVTSTTRVQPILKSTLSNVQNIRRTRKIAISNNNTKPATSAITSNAFLLPTTAIASPVITTSSINSGGNTFQNLRPVATQKKIAVPNLLSSDKYILSSSGIQTIKNEVVQKTPFQHSILKPQTGRTLTQNLQSTNKLAKLKPVKTLMQIVPNVKSANKLVTAKNISLNNIKGMKLISSNIQSSPGTLKGAKLSAIKSATHSPSTNYLIMPSNSSNPSGENPQNIKFIVLQPSTQTPKTTNNQAPLNNWTNSTTEKLANRKPVVQRPKQANKRGRPKKDSTRPQLVEHKEAVFEDQEEVKEKITRCGRLSRPPPHIINDYEQIHAVSLTQPDVDDSNGDIVTEVEPPKELLPGLEGPKRNISDDFKCPTCKKVYLGRSKMANHFEKNPTHGNFDQLPPPKFSSLEYKKNNLKKKRRGPWSSPEEKSARRQENLQKALNDCNETEVANVATKSVLKSTSLYDLMLIKCNNNVESVLDELKNLMNEVKEKIIPRLRRTSDEDCGSEGTVNLVQQTICDALKMMPGVYKIDSNVLGREELSEDEEPPMKKYKAHSKTKEQPILEDTASSGFSEGSDNSSSPHAVDFRTDLSPTPENPPPQYETNKKIVISNPQIQNDLNESNEFIKVDFISSCNNSSDKISEGKLHEKNSDSTIREKFSTVYTDANKNVENISLELNRTELKSATYVVSEENSTGNIVDMATLINVDEIHNSSQMSPLEQAVLEDFDVDKLDEVISGDLLILQKLSKE